MADPQETEDTYADAIALLRHMPRGRHDRATARAAFQRFQSRHTHIKARLVADLPPASNVVDYDVLLTEPGGTVSLSWTGDAGLPWSTIHAEHWAANAVLTVDGEDTSIQSALIYLNAALNRRPDFMADLVDRSLIWTAVEADLPEVSSEELAAAVNAFRLRQGLSDPAALQRWLDEMQLTQESMGQLVLETVQTAKFKRTVVAGRVEPYFAAHAEDFASVSVLLLDSASPVEAERIAEQWQRTGRCPALEPGAEGPPIEGRLRHLLARDLPAEFAEAPVGAVVATANGNGGGQVGQLIRRSPALLDDATSRRIAALLFEEWLAIRRRQAVIRWHWV